ncbi:MAG TPA: hypothetical protein VF653_10085, partial [Methylomirabilota bacterium]
YLAAAFYCLWGLFVYATLIIALAAASPESARAVLGELLKSINLSSLSSLVPAEILAALLVTVLLPKVPVVAGADSWVREQIEYMASIPYEVRRLAAELERSDVRGSGVTYRMPAASVDRVRRRMQSHELPQLLTGTTGQTDLGPTWAKLSALVLALADWRTDSRLASVCHTCAAAIDELVQAHEDLVPRVRRCLRTGTPAPTASGSTVVSPEYAEEVERQVKTLLGKVYRALAAATLRFDLTHRARTTRLAKFGFRFDETLDSVPILVAHRLTALYAALAFGFLAVKILLARLGIATWPGYRLTLALSAAIPLSYVVAVLWAIFLKRSWGGTTRPRGEPRPFIAYLLSGLLAAASNLPIALSLAVLAHHVRSDEELKVLDALAKSMVWLLLSFTTAATTAFLIDDQPRAIARRWGGRWSEAAVQGIVTGTIAYLVGSILIETGLDTAERLRLPQLIPIAGAIGFTVGFFVPTWYRKPARRQTRRASDGPRRRRARREPAMAVAERPTWPSRATA